MMQSMCKCVGDCVASTGI